METRKKEQIDVKDEDDVEEKEWEKNEEKREALRRRQKERVGWELETKM